MEKSGLETLIAEEKEKIWNDPETADDHETLGILISKFSKWEGETIIKTFLAALEDSNFHSLAEKIETLSDNYFEEAA
jgi:hypothetical protein